VFALAARKLVESVVEGSGGEAGRRVSHVEVWNEPEFPFFWDPRFETGPGKLDEYFAMAARTLFELDAYRKASSAAAAKALHIGFGSFAKSETAVAAVSAFDTPIGAAGIVPFDFVSFHVYGEPPFGDPLAMADRIRAVVAAVRASKHADAEVVLAEWGPNLEQSATDENATGMKPALMMTTVLALGATAGLSRAHHTFFWEYFAPLRWGLLDHDMRPRPLYRAYEQLARTIATGSTRVAVRGAQDGRLEGGTGAVLAATAAGETRVLVVNRGGAARNVRVSYGTPRALHVFDEPHGPVRDVAPSEVFTVPAQSIVVATY
jgi:hypothetical protein